MNYVYLCYISSSKFPAWRPNCVWGYGAQVVRSLNYSRRSPRDSLLCKCIRGSSKELLYTRQPLLCYTLLSEANLRPSTLPFQGQMCSLWTCWLRQSSLSPQVSGTEWHRNPGILEQNGRTLQDVSWSSRSWYKKCTCCSQTARDLEVRLWSEPPSPNPIKPKHTSKHLENKYHT